MAAGDQQLQAAVDQACKQLGISTPFSWKDLPVDACLPAARIACLSEEELSVLPAEFPHCVVSPRNEAAALSLLVSNLAEACSGEGGDERRAALLECCDAYAESLAGDEAGEGEGTPCPESSPEAELIRWATQRGVTSALCGATFGAGLRGLMPCDADLQPGECAVSVPADVIITSTTAWQSDLGAVLAKFPGLTDDMAALIWTLVDSRDDESSWKPFWSSLPEAFNTGLSAPESAVEVLEGTPALAELLQARQVLSSQYASVQPLLSGLLRAYGSSLKPQWFSWERFVWAAELWYAYAIQVEFADGSQLSGLVPLVCFMNHSPTPHIVRFSAVDKATNCLKLRPFRRCPRGKQCRLSYGPLPNAHLLVFYGFALTDNPFDVFPLSFEIEEGDPYESQKRALLSALSVPLDHNLRPPPAPLPPRLLDCVRVVIADEDAMRAMGAAQSAAAASWKGGPVDEENEAATLSVMASMLEDLLEPFAAAADNGGAPHPFAAAARAYIHGQAAILRHALQLCADRTAE